VFGGISKEFIKYIQCLEMTKGFDTTLKMIVNLEVTSQFGERVQVLNEGEVLARIALGLLSDKKGQIKVIEPKGILI
jgi:aspartate ammonia-lyase